MPSLSFSCSLLNFSTQTREVVTKVSFQQQSSSVQKATIVLVSSYFVWIAFETLIHIISTKVETWEWFTWWTLFLFSCKRLTFPLLDQKICNTSSISTAFHYSHDPNTWSKTGMGCRYIRCHHNMGYNGKHEVSAGKLENIKILNNISYLDITTKRPNSNSPK